MESPVECVECSTWEQTIYWTHFQFIHFCQILGSDFRSQLMIPKKFSDFARGKLQDKVTLKGPSGTTTWEVGLETVGNTLFLRDGWTEFVNAFSLEQNDILIFKYDGDSSFAILIFDRGSLCEKEKSYFTKKCGHSRPGNRIQEKGFLKEINPEEFTQEHSHKEFKSTPSKKLRKDTDEQNLSCPEQHIASDVPERSQMKAPYIAAEKSPKDQQKSWSWEPVELPPVNEKQKRPPTKVPCINIASHVSKRAVTEQQKEATLCMARKELTVDSFLAVMRPTGVYRIFYLNIPAAWIKQHLSFKNQTVKLRTNEKTWPTKLLCRPNGLRGGLTLGWKEFVRDNCLEEYDVCVFKLASCQKHDPVILDVSIFRIIPIAM